MVHCDKRLLDRAARKIPLGVVLFGAWFVLASCGEVGFKRGSSAGSFAADQRACHQQASGDGAFQSCLERAGWVAASLDTASTPEPAAPLSAPAAAAPSAITASSAVPEPAPPAADPLRPVSVGSWWKFGGGDQDLKASVDQCVAQLGPAHRPDALYHSVTQALQACLGDHGWHAVGHAT